MVATGALQSTPARAEAVGGLPLVLAACSAGAGLVHAAMAPAHVAEWPAEGRAFAALAVAQLLVAAAAVVHPGRALWWAAAAIQLPALAGWAWSRSVGLPWGPSPGVAEDVAWIDGAAVALEVAVVVLAVRLLLGPGATAAPAGTRRVPAWSGALAVAVVAGAGILVASPAGQHTHGGAAHVADHAGGADHAEEGPAEGAGHEHGGDDHEPAGPLPAAERARLGEQLTEAREVALRLPTVADAKAAGLQQAGNFVPGSAAHYVDLDRGLATDFLLDRPLAWLYSGTSDTSTVVGVMYYGATDGAPEGFVGPLDVWHQHTGACYRIEADGQIYVPFSPDHDGTRAECARHDGQYIEQTGWMVHAWVVPGWDSPSGVFSHDNPDIVCADGRRTVVDQSVGCVGA